MKTILGCLGVILIVSVSHSGAEAASPSSDHLYNGLARDLISAASEAEPTWTCKVGVEIDDFAHPPYLPESDEQAAQTNRLLTRIVQQLRPAGALSMVHDRLVAEWEDQSLDLDVQLTVFKSQRACQDVWERKLPEHVREEMVTVDNIGDACFKRPGRALTYFYLRRNNVFVEAKSQHDHDVLLQWLQRLDQLILTPPTEATSTDPNDVI